MDHNKLGPWIDEHNIRALTKRECGLGAGSRKKALDAELKAIKRKILALIDPAAESALDRERADARSLADAAQSAIDWENDYRTRNNLGKYPPRPFMQLAVALAALRQAAGEPESK